jgi:hypothetical protein
VPSFQTPENVLYRRRRPLVSQGGRNLAAQPFVKYGVTFAHQPQRIVHDLAGAIIPATVELLPQNRLLSCT